MPRDQGGFLVDRTGPTPDKLADLSIAAGRMYVDGILVENDADTTYWEQPYGHLDEGVDPLPDGTGYVVYVRVWEREATVAEDDDLREVALGIHSPDTTARLHVVWQVAATPVDVAAKNAADAWAAFRTDRLQPRGRMRARARVPEDADLDVCSVSPEAMYRGQENQLYRVEVFRSGPARSVEPVVRRGRRGAAAAAAADVPAQVVWSRDNGADVYRISRLAGAEVTVADLGRDRRSSLDVGDLVEIVDDGAVDRLGRDLGDSVGRFLYTVTAVDQLRRTVTLDRDPAGEAGEVGHDPGLHPLLRRWDGGPLDLEEELWLPLEDGVEVQFAPAEDGQGPYRTGDHWLVPARRTIGDVIWPQSDDGPVFRSADGIDYHYAALAFVPGTAAGKVGDLRATFAPLIG